MILKTCNYYAVIDATKGPDTMSDLWKRLINGDVISKEIAIALEKKWNSMKLENRHGEY